MNQADHEHALTRRIARWAVTNDAVRAVLLTSSRANSNAPLDALSDHDVILYVTDADRFDAQDRWLTEFGDVLVQFREPRTHDGMSEYARLVLYADGTKIDFTIISIEHLRLVANAAALPDYLDVGYTVLVDKDRLTDTLLPPSYRAHFPMKPTPEAYRALVEEFWWETTYVAKNLWRDELMQARYCLDSVMRYDLLRRMLEWYVESGREWSWKPGVLGRGLKGALPTEIWSALEETFADASIEANWRALFQMTALFRQVAGTVATSLGYEYPQELDTGVTRYLEKIRQMARDGT